MKKNGFELIKHLDIFYFKPLGSLILIIKIENNYVQKKYWINNTEDNINFIKNDKLPYNNSFETFYSDEDQNYNLYPEGIDKPFYEKFAVEKKTALILNVLKLFLNMTWLSILWPTFIKKIKII